MPEKYFWAWLSLKKGSLQPHWSEELDDAILSILLDKIFTRSVADGDGRFSRLVNYARSVHEQILFAKQNMSLTCEVRAAFLLALEVTFELVLREAEKIKKSR